MQNVFPVILACLANIVHALLIFSLAPGVAGVVGKLRAWALGRRGAPVIQPYRMLYKLLRKSTLIPETATEAYPYWPLACFLSLSVAALLIPSFCTGMVTAGLSDFITLIGLFALSRAATMLGGLETGFGFGGAGAQREALFGIFAEGALLVTILTFALLSHTATIDGIAVAFRDGHVGVSVSLAFALAATLAVALTENGRIPTDNPAGHLELAMVHEAMLLEYSGRYLLLFEYAAMLRLTLWMSLIGAVFLPFYMGNAVNMLSWPGGIVLWLLKLGAMAVVLPLFEISSAKMRVFRVPEFLGVAMLLGALAGVFLFVAERIGS
jgi:formate hydrogenlyase subunit 4